MNKLHITAASTAILVLCLSAWSLAQQTPAPPARSRVGVVHLKTDMVNEWINIQKNEVIPAWKKAGVKSRSTFRTVLGDTNEFVIVSPLDKYAQLDGPGPTARALGTEAAAKINAKLDKCIESQQVYIITSQPDVSYSPEGAAPPISVFTRRRVAPGRLDEYLNMVKTEVMPIYKKAGERLTVARRGLGANNNDLVTRDYVNKMADLDAGPLATRVLGQAGAAKLAAKTTAIAPIVEQVVRQLVAELSY